MDIAKTGSLDDQPKTMYIGILSRGGLKNPSLPMSSAVSEAFVILDATLETLRNSHVPARKAGMRIVQHYLDFSSSFESTHGSPFCSSYESSMQLFFNNQRKRSN